MFERYTEKARRTIFFARYEASQYGSPYIETEHLLLGLLKEDPNLVKHLPSCKTLNEVRREVEKRIYVRERISTSVEVPLSADCKRALHLAAEEANLLASRHIGTEHLFMGLAQIQGCIAAEILRTDSLTLQKLRKTLGGTYTQVPSQETRTPSGTAEPEEAVQQFLAALRNGSRDDLKAIFLAESRFIDASGKVWKGQEEIMKNVEILLAPFAKRNAKPRYGSATYMDAFLWVSTLVWEDVHLPGFSALDLIRMSVVFRFDRGLLIYLIQLTAVGPERMTIAHTA